jgi:hypothetical protein
MEAQHRPGELEQKIKAATFFQVDFRERRARIACLVPDPLRLRDALQIISASWPRSCLVLDNGQIPSRDLCRRNRSVPSVTWLPFWQSEPAPHVVAARAHVVISVRVDYEPIWRARLETNAQ